MLSETARLQGEGESERSPFLRRGDEGDAPSQVLFRQQPHAPCAETPVPALRGKIASEYLLLNRRLDVRGIVHGEPGVVTSSLAEPDGHDRTRGGRLESVFQHV